VKPRFDRLGSVAGDSELDAGGSKGVGAPHTTPGSVPYAPDGLDDVEPGRLFLLSMMIVRLSCSQAASVASSRSTDSAISAMRRARRLVGDDDGSL